MQHEGETRIVLRDPSHFSDAVVLLSPAAMAALAMMDGRRTLPEVQQGLVSRYGMAPPLADLEELVRRMDACHFLDSEAYRRERHDRLEEFRRLPDRPPFLAGKAYPEEPGALEALLDRFAPDAVVNCVGVIKQRPEASAAEETMEVNGRLPHLLADLCAPARLVHFSTDCVFSGARGGYRPEDPPDAEDLYGRSKLAGEVDRPGCLTLRTSIVGWELKGHRGLLEWFASNRGRTVKGFRRGVFSGLSTEEIARAFLGPVPTISQRLVRAKRTLAKHRVAFEAPAGPVWSHVQRRSVTDDDSQISSSGLSPPAITGAASLRTNSALMSSCR